MTEKERNGYTIESTETGASSTCLQCHAWRVICIRCQDPTKSAQMTLPPPFGSRLSNIDIRVCDECYLHAVNAVRVVLGLPQEARL